MAERRATLLGLNPSPGYAVTVVQHEPPEKPTSTDLIKTAINRITSQRKPDEPDGNDRGELH